MSHLLAISVGPVQEFIAAARRTRDLWFGSYLLSEISKAVAKCVRDDHGGTLIFPHPSTILESGHPEINVANVILAEVSTADPNDIAEKAKKEAQRRWRHYADEAEQIVSGVIHTRVWKDQVEDVIEFYATWVPYDPNRYVVARAAVMRLQAGRKNCRDFLPANGLAGLPKSSLDGQRESVLHPQEKWQDTFRRWLRVRRGEQLDVVGVTKRVAGGNPSYPSVSRIAADPWVRGNQKRLDPVKHACEELRRKEIIRKLDTSAQGYPQFKLFPYEGTTVYTTRHHELMEEAAITLDDLRPLREALAGLPQPEPYLAVLVGDGDKMGAAISALTSANANRDFSQSLSGFADNARKIVAEHNGVLVYAGGDDVLAFLPVDKCLQCARELHDTFGALLRRFKNKEDKSPTLSVGVAIGHFMENLEDLLQYGRDAEKAAKKEDGKDALAVHLHKRGGAPIKVRGKWSDEKLTREIILDEGTLTEGRYELSRPDARLTCYARLMNAQAIPSKLPYDLRKLADLYDETWPAETAPQALRQDVLRVIRDKQPRSGRRYMSQIKQILQSSVKGTVALQSFANELLVARQIATARQQAGEVDG
jgi:CRISPR-associated protein Cmr2